LTGGRLPRPCFSRAAGTAGAGNVAQSGISGASEI
jgi:hypothetical protein